LVWKHKQIETTRTITADTTSPSFNVGGSKNIVIFIVVTAVGGTGPTLDISVQSRMFLEYNWADTGKAFKTISDKGTYMLPINEFIGNMLRLFYDVGGTTPSFTFRVYVQWLE